MFRAIILPIFRSTILCVTACGIMPADSLDAEVLPHPGYQPATSWVYYTTSCKHGLVLLKMDEIITQNMLS